MTWQCFLLNRTVTTESSTISQHGALPISRPAPAPEADFPLNGGLEALAPDPERGADAYVVGGEESGETWTCRLTAACVQGPTVAKGAEFGLVAMRRLPGDQSAYLLRAWDPLRGSRIVLTIAGPAGEVARMEMSKPLTVDNFEIGRASCRERV